jgi:hypothetical protein
MEENESRDLEEIDISKIATLPPEEIFQKIIDPVAQKCAEKLGSSFLILYYPNVAEVGMYPSNVSLVYSFIKSVDKEKPLAVFLHSLGGDIHTAYKLVKLFHKCCEYKAIIPEYAKSAATLVAIGADKILMSPIAELGPLDPIIMVDGEPVPAFAIRDAPKVLEREIESCKDSEVRALKAEHILGPIAVKINPYLLSSVSDLPSLAKDYGKKILLARRYKEAVAERVMSRLTELGHPSHGYVVDLEEAINLGLNAEEMDKEIEDLFSLLLLLLRLYESACQRNGHPIDKAIIKLYSPKERENKTSEKNKTEQKDEEKSQKLNSELLQ